ncbi:hypothetical protein CFP56_043303 [Quercus suber]|uniref:Uncharacterized protein n=1 Tax=Quercus suber TaxID=58331 RepID=A0AAW0LJ35_QUESU
MKILISFCKHSLPPGPHQIRNLTTGDQQHSIDSIELGLDEATLRNYPKLIYAQAKLQKGNSTASCCQYAWLITKTRMCCACCLIVVISFMSSVLTRGYSNKLRAPCVGTRLLLRRLFQWNDVEKSVRLTK